MIEYLFSYGTLRRDDVQEKLFGRLLNGSSDILKGYRTARVEIHDVAFLSKGEANIQLTLQVSPIESDTIEGTVFEVSPEELLDADTYEPIEYKRFKVTLESGKQAWAYMAT